MSSASGSMPVGGPTFVQRGFQLPQSLSIDPSMLSGIPQPSRPATAVTPDSVPPPLQRHSASHTGDGKSSASYFKAPWAAPDSLANASKSGPSPRHAQGSASATSPAAGRPTMSAHDEFTEALQSLVSQQQQRSHAQIGVSSSHWAWLHSNGPSTSQPSSAFLRSTSGDQPLTAHNQHTRHNKSASSGGFDFRGQGYNFHGYSPTSPKSQPTSLSPSLLGLSSTSEQLSLQQAQAILAQQLAAAAIDQDRTSADANLRSPAADRQVPFTATSPRSTGGFSLSAWSASDQLNHSLNRGLHYTLSASASTVATDQQSVPPSRIFSPSHTAPSSVGGQSLPASDFSGSVNVFDDAEDIKPSKRSASAGRKRPTSIDRESGRDDDTDTAERPRGRKAATGGKWPPQTRASRSKTRKLNTARTNSPRGTAAPEGRLSADGTSTNNITSAVALENKTETTMNLVQMQQGPYSQAMYSTSSLQYSSTHSSQPQQHQPLQSQSMYACSNASEEAVNAAPRYVPPPPSYFADANPPILAEPPLEAWTANAGAAYKYDALPPLAAVNHEHRFSAGLDSFTPMSNDTSPVVGLGLPLPDETFPAVLRHHIDSLRGSPPARERDEEDDPREERYPPTEDRRKKRRESHNLVERRRRDNINDRITELAALLPDMLLEHTSQSAESENGGRKVKGILLTGLPAGSPPMPVASLSLTPAQIAQQNSSSKPNKGVILSKSVEYIRYLQQIVSLQADRNRELENKLKGVEARPVLPNHIARHQAALTQKPASSGTGSQTGSTAVSDSPLSNVGAPHTSVSPSVESVGRSVASEEQLYGEVNEASISDIFARYGYNHGKMADIEEALGE